MRELQRLKDKQSEVSGKELQALREDLLRKEIRLREMEKTIVEKEQEAGRITLRAQEESRDEVKRLQEAKAELERKQKKMRAMLDEYVRKLKDQVCAADMFRDILHFSCIYMHPPSVVNRVYTYTIFLNQQAQKILLRTSELPVVHLADNCYSLMQRAN